MKRIAIVAPVLAATIFVISGEVSVHARPEGRPATSPIQHIVIIYQENHSFDDMLGYLCVTEGGRCDGADTGQISDGSTIPLSAEPDIVPETGHRHPDQVAAINGGLMNGWDHVSGCDVGGTYPCMTQAHPGAVPSLWSLADAYTISDRTFETDLSPSWGSHLELVSANLEQFTGDPYHGSLADRSPTLYHSGCNSHQDAWWLNLTGNLTLVPACIPDKNGHGPYRTSPAYYIPTIMDSLDSAGLTWKIYAPGKQSGGYGWSICPTFYECLSTDQSKHVEQPRDFARAAKAGKLPNVSIVIPYPGESQHPKHSLIRGDDWIASNVSAVMNNQAMWDSSAIFITYDDCGCLYDHVNPPAGYGIRVPMVIVSPYAKPQYVDHNVADLASMLAFIEATYGIPPLPGGADDGDYDYADSFNFSQSPLPPIRLTQHPVPHSSIVYERTHPFDHDDT